ncbi:hypothetical protein OG21DRAFT_1482658 [Imleria badia]|nr:hypothetical protein OG21DRAFT_1482658 [Imleria badia]
MNPTPLPPNPFPESAFQTAYQRCLVFKAEANAGLKPSHPGCPPPVVCARLGHLLRLAPNSNGRGQVQREITLAADDTKLMEVARVYFNGFIRTFKRSSGPTPAPSEHPSRPSFEDARAYATALMQEGQLDHRKARSAALYRSDYRYMISGRRSNTHGGTAYVTAAHIIPEATNTKIDQSDKKRFHSAGVWAILSMFTDVDIIPQLAGNNIHRLENVILMYQIQIQIFHNLFDDLLMWLKPVEGRPHTYRIHLAREEYRTDERIPELVTFSTATDLPLPDSAYLALHALCCEVAWMSGAAEHIMDIERRMDGTNVLASDGTTADLLASALASHIPVH